MSRIVGFTGTREGLTSAQRQSLELFLIGETDAVEFHHGDCVGADTVFHELIFTHCRGRRASVHLHPCTINSMRAWCAPLGGDIGVAEHESLAPLVRNRKIVEAAEVLVACPRGTEEMRSGTWATVREARRRGKVILICWPDGKMEWERPVRDEA